MCKELNMYPTFPFLLAQMWGPIMKIPYLQNNLISFSILTPWNILSDKNEVNKPHKFVTITLYINVNQGLPNIND